MKTILCFGDSNTFGYDPRDGGRYDRKYRWVDMLCEDGFYAINEGLNGREIPTSVAEYGHLNSIITRHGNIDILLLNLGVNDAYNMRSPNAKDIANRWRKVFEKVPTIKALRERKVPIILVSPPVGSADVWGNDKADEILDALEGLAGEYKKLADDLGLIFVDANSFGVELAFDGVHFTESGSESFYRGIVKVCKEYSDTKERSKTIG